MKLYKYRSLTGDAFQWTQQIIKTSSFYFATPPVLNDLMDVQLRVCADQLSDQYILNWLGKGNAKNAEEFEIFQQKTKIITEELKKDLLFIRNTFTQKLNDFYEYTDQLGVLSLSAEPMSTLMWAHYADCFTGCCIEIEVLENLIEGEICRPVNYIDSYPEYFLENILSCDAERFVEIALEMQHIKAKCWNYEKEWRFIHGKGAREYQSPGKITALILGCKIIFTPELLNLISFCQTNDINVKQLNFKPFSFEPEIKPYMGGKC
ncbi:MAG: DUF2971 domain-containing protein [Colwellia sp.]